MDEETFNKEIKENYSIGSELFLKWDRGNGTLAGLVKLKGFDGEKPLLCLKGKNDYLDGIYLDMKHIGYDSIISIQGITRIKLALSP